MMQWSPFAARLRCLAVIVAGLACCDVAAAKQISCTKSGVAFDHAAYSAEYEFLCKKETVDEDSFDQLRATKPKNWQQLIDFGQAFLPPNTVVDGTIMSSRKGHYGSVYMVTAIGPVHLTEPKFHLAIEAITRANPLGVPGTVTWRQPETRSATIRSSSITRLFRRATSAAARANAWGSSATSAARRPATRSG